MSRLVEPRDGRFLQRLAAKPGMEGYLERVVKYVPVEIVAAYTAFCGLAHQIAPELRWGVIVGFFALCVILTPIYLSMFGKGQSRRGVQLAVSTVAFIVWAYALGGLGGFFGLDGVGGYDPALASTLLIVFTLISALVVPKKQALHPG